MSTANSVITQIDLHSAGTLSFSEIDPSFLPWVTSSYTGATVAYELKRLTYYRAKRWLLFLYPL